jgi:UDP-glucose 4-epimerase
MAKCLITGGLGFIGSHLVDALIEQDHQVVVVDDLSTGTLVNGNSEAIYCPGDITQKSLAQVFDDNQFEYVFHLAAQINLRHSIKDPQFDAHTNILGSLNVLENCVRTGVRQVIFASTGGAIYWPVASLPWNEGTTLTPLSPYGIAKLTVEKYLRFFQHEHGLRSTILRYSNVYGPRQISISEAGVISIFIERALKNQDLVIYGDGKQTRDFVYVDDVISANLLAMEKGLSGAYNVSSNTQCSVQEIADRILTETKSQSQLGYTDPIAGEVRDTRLENSKLRSEGWENKIPLFVGLEKTIGWFGGNK